MKIENTGVIEAFETFVLLGE